MVKYLSGIALLAGLAAVAAVPTAQACGRRAQPCAVPCCPAPCCPAPCCAPAFKTVCCTEWVAEQVPCTRTTYKTECKTEVYTAYKHECVPEVRSRTVCCYKMVPEVQTCTRNVCVAVPCVETKTVMQSHVSCHPVTKIVRKMEDHGHWDCVMVPARPTLRERLGRLCGRGCDCPRLEPKKVWVPCRVCVEVPVTVMERVCEMRPVTVQVHTCKYETRQEAYQVTVHKCVPETRVENYTVMVSRCVPYQASRTVAVCVPCTETVLVTRMVPHTVTKQVPVTPCCNPAPCCGH